jgi:hypothetical protein
MYQPLMSLTPEQTGILEGKEGATKAKMMECLVRYGDVFGAKRMAEVTHKEGHLVTSFGIPMLGTVYTTMDELISSGAVCQRWLHRRSATLRFQERQMQSDREDDFLEDHVRQARRATKSSSKKLASSRKMRSAAPATSPRWATPRKRAMSFPGPKVAPSSSPTRF